MNLPDVSSEAGWAGAIVLFLGAAAAALNKYSTQRSETNRQVQNDNNATRWQNDLIEENKALRKARDDNFEQRSKESAEKYELKAENLVLKEQLKSSGQILASNAQLLAVTNAALEGANREIENLRDDLLHQRAQFRLLENLKVINKNEH